MPWWAGGGRPKQGGIGSLRMDACESDTHERSNVVSCPYPASRRRIGTSSESLGFAARNPYLSLLIAGGNKRIERLLQPLEP